LSACCSIVKRYFLSHFDLNFAFDNYTPPPRFTAILGVASCQRRLDSRPQSIMGIERLIPRVASLTVDCRGVNISLTKPWLNQYGSFQTTRVSDCDTLWKETASYCCIVAIIIMTCVLLYQVYLFLNCMGHDVILAL
jgi:hypothetical protein